MNNLSQRPQKVNFREQQKLSTRQRILSSAIYCLIDLGVAKTTTLAVQRRAEVSRGALLHHFPTHADLLTAIMQEIVVKNEQAVEKIFSLYPPKSDPIEFAINTLVHCFNDPSFMAEIELWLVSRHDAELREILICAEKAVINKRKSVMEQIFAPFIHLPSYHLIVDISIEFARGVAVSDILRKNPNSKQRLIQQWIWAIRQFVHQTPPEFNHKLKEED